MNKFISIACTFALSGCGTIQTGFAPIDAVYNVSSALLKNKEAVKNCEQGHPQDRENCRAAKKRQVDALNKSLEKNKRN